MRQDRSRREFIRSGTLLGSMALAGCGGVPLGEPGGGGDSAAEDEDEEEEADEDATGPTETDGATPTATREETPTAIDAAIPMGSILPISGALRAFGPGMQAAVELAVEDVNAAGGPLGREIELNDRDSETSPDRAVQKYRSLVDEEGIVGFVGAASSGVSTAIARNVADDEVMQVSNASSSPALAEFAIENGVDYFGRTASNDAQQGVVMGMILDDYVRADTAVFLHVDNGYGVGLAREAEAAFDGETLRLVPYDQQTSDYTATLDEVFQGGPDGVGFVGYPESGQSILETWADGGYGGQWVLSDGLNTPNLFQAIPDIVEGMYVASPDPAETEGTSRFEEKIGDQNTLFAAHAYDALVLQALAMHKAREASGTAIARNIRSVSRPPGTEVTVGELEKAFGLLDTGTPINYQGASSPVDLDEQLEVLNRFTVLQVENGSTTTVETIPRSEFS